MPDGVLAHATALVDTNNALPLEVSSRAINMMKH